jgi:hypothetical protein
MDESLSVALSGLLGILAGSFCIITFLKPDANSLTRGFDRMWRMLTYPKSVSPRLIYLMGGVVAIVIGVVALAQAFGLIQLPRR